MKKYEIAQMVVKMGISIIPLHHRSKEPALHAWKQYTHILSSQLELREWLSSDWNNYGIVCGWQNLVVIDFDSLDWFALWLEWCKMDPCTQYIAQTAYKVITRQGMHVYLRTVEPCANSKRIARSGGIDVQSCGKYVVGPGSVHPCGHVYQPIGAMHFPVVECIDAILPLNLFPLASSDTCAYAGEPVSLPNTEYQTDPLAFAQMDLIGKVKASVRIESFFSGVQRSSADGRWLKALCPFHADAHQSAWIDTKRQLCGCQVCGMKPMDAINFVARARGIDERAAIHAMAAEVGIWR